MSSELNYKTWEKNFCVMLYTPKLPPQCIKRFGKEDGLYSFYHPAYIEALQ